MMGNTAKHDFVTKLEEQRDELANLLEFGTKMRDLVGAPDKTFWRRSCRQIDDAISQVDAALAACYEELNK